MPDGGLPAIGRADGLLAPVKQRIGFGIRKRGTFAMVLKERTSRPREVSNLRP
ncbi:MAG: hypothetical protein JO273_02940 [Methylobacteriaceae bacterium]|nr:hypothetical protein [Methylobacteriaceae bacterium]